MASAKFYLTKKNGASEYPVYLNYSFNYSEKRNGKKKYKRFRYSTGLKIHPTFWNVNRQRAKETSKFPQYPEFNARLDNLVSTINTIRNNLINNEETPTPEKLKSELDKKYKGLTAPTKKIQLNYLMQYIDFFIKDNEKRKTYRTIQKYGTTQKRLQSFLESKGKSDIEFKDIDLQFYYDFKDFLSENYEYAPNTVGKHIKTFKTFLNGGLDAGIHQNRIHKSKKFVAYNKPTEKIYLNDSDLEKLYNVDLSHNKTYDKVRDLFLIGCYTALRFSDFTAIKEENIITKGHNEFIKKRTQKTGRFVYLPMHYIVRDILKKYDNKLPEPISNQRMNKYIKEIGKLAGINDTEIKYIHKKGNQVLEKNCKKYELITTHTARRTGATNMYKMGIPSIDIMKFTGHTTERAFLRYIRISEEETAERLADHKFFKPPMKKVN